MKILVISNLYPPNVRGGYELGCAGMVKQLRTMGHVVTVLTSRGPSDFHESGAKDIKPVLNLSDTFGREQLGNALSATSMFHGRVIDLSNIGWILDELTSTRYDVVYCFNLEGLGSLAICDLLTDLRVPWVWHLMDCVPRLMVHDLRPEVGALFSTYSTREVRASRIFAMSRQLLREIDEVGISLGRAVTIVPGWAPDPANPPDRKTGEKLRFVAVGTVSEEKGTEIIIDALSCADSSIVRNVSVDFFGGGDIARFQSKAGSLGLAGSVCFRGQQSHEQVMKELATYDGLLFPTWKREPFGFAALEAAVNGVTPVITKGIGASEVLTDGLHSIQIGRSAAELAKVIESAYRDRDGFRAIGERAASHVRSNFLLPYLARQVEQELLSVADNTEISRELAHKFLNINRFKYRCAQRYVTAFAPAQMGMSDIDLAASYRRLKETGRVASRGIIMKLLRSGAMKLMRPYLLDLLGREREVNERLNLLNYKIDSIASRIEKLAERDTVEPLRSDLDDPIQR